MFGFLVLYCYIYFLYLFIVYFLINMKLDRLVKRLVQWAGLVSLVKYITIPDSHDEAGEVK